MLPEASDVPRTVSGWVAAAFMVRVRAGEVESPPDETWTLKV
jgi:hypothetical protein